MTNPSNTGSRVLPASVVVVTVVAAFAVRAVSVVAFAVVLTVVLNHDHRRVLLPAPVLAGIGHGVRRFAARLRAFLWRTTPAPLPLVSFLEFLAVIATLVGAAHLLPTPDSRWIRRAPRSDDDGRAPEPAVMRVPAERSGATINPSSDHRAAHPPSPA